MKKLFGIWVLLALATGVWGKTATIYHTSDSHGFFYARNGRGGFAALAAVLNNGPKDYLLLDAGDFAEGTAETKASQGQKAVQLMNRLGYDAATIGNHEFAYGDKALAALVKQADFDVLAANFFEAGSLRRPAGVKAYQVYEVNGIKIAVIGLANRYPTKKSTAYTFSAPLQALENALNEPLVKQANVVVVLVHDSLADDRPGHPFYVGDIARKFGGRVHIVLGGHAHKIFENKKVNGVLFSEVGSNLLSVGKITLTTDDKTGKLSSLRGQLVTLDIDSTGQDEAVCAYAESLKEPGMDEVLGYAAEALPKNPQGAGIKDGAMADWIADVGRACSGADIFVTNTAGVRVGLSAGEVTRRDLIDVFPFDDTVVMLEVDGRFIKRWVQQSLLPRNLLAYSGLTVTYQNQNGKVKNMQILIDGKPVQNRKIYRLAVNSYLAQGRGEGKIFSTVDAAKKQTVCAASLRSLLEQALSAGPLHAPITGRVYEK